MVQVSSKILFAMLLLAFSIAVSLPNTDATRKLLDDSLTGLGELDRAQLLAALQQVQAVLNKAKQAGGTTVDPKELEDPIQKLQGLANIASIFQSAIQTFLDKFKETNPGGDTVGSPVDLKTLTGAFAPLEIILAFINAGNPLGGATDPGALLGKVAGGTGGLKGVLPLPGAVVP